jgi:hypothetical protein
MTCNKEVCTCLTDEIQRRTANIAKAEERDLIIEMLTNAKRSGDFPQQRTGLEKAIRLIEVMNRVRPQ